MDCSMPGFPVHHYLWEFTQIYAHWVNDAMQPSNPLHALGLLSLIFFSIKVFSNELAFHIRWPNYWSFSFSISLPMNSKVWFPLEFYWLDLLEVQRTLKKHLQRHNSKASVLWHSAFFTSKSYTLHDYWENHRFDYIDLCQQSDVSAF